MSRINTFDLDGVIYLGKTLRGVYPGEQDHIVTGRSVDEMDYTLKQLHDRGIFNVIHFNPLPFDQKTRESSGHHKANTILKLKQQGYEHGVHFEDDPVQVKILLERIPDITIVQVISDLVNLENHWNE
jgi:hypothetical protein